ncbi:MAG: serine/threonine-protein kinase [Blastocatellia bacterium]
MVEPEITLSKGCNIGPYTLVRELGRGAFGVVWLAKRRSALPTPEVALKLPQKRLVNLDAIRQEAAIWVQAAGHPNVLPIIEADIYGEFVALASEYAAEGSLQDWLEKYSGIAPTTDAAFEMTFGILDGLAHLHQRDIVHRDLKPANILLQGNKPRIADFGISRLLPPASHSHSIAGTPYYMAPEAFSGKRSPQTDLWAVGVVFYQMLVGRMPFHGADRHALEKAIRTDEPAPLPFPSDSAVTTVITRAFQKDPALRFQSAAAMKAELKAAMQDGLLFSTEMLSQPSPPASDDTPAAATHQGLAEVEHLIGKEITIAGAIREGAPPQTDNNAAVAELKAGKIKAEKFTLAGRIDKKTAE